MIVCVCKGLNERDVRATIRAGETTVEGLGRACQAGTDCGSCKVTLRQMLKENPVREAVCATTK